MFDGRKYQDEETFEVDCSNISFPTFPSHKWGWFIINILQSLPQLPPRGKQA